MILEKIWNVIDLAEEVKSKCLISKGNFVEAINIEISKEKSKEKSSKKIETRLADAREIEESISVFK